MKLRNKYTLTLKKWTISTLLVMAPLLVLAQLPGVPIPIPPIPTPPVLNGGKPTNVLNTYPTPYANKAASYRACYLYKASEIPGNTGGEQLITAMFFFVDAFQGLPLYNFTIKLKQVNWDELPLSIPSDGIEVWGPETYIEHDSTNTHNFHTGFCWDGVSNILVDICVNNPPDEISNNASILVNTPEPGKKLSYHDWSDTGNPICNPADRTNNAKLYEERPLTSFNIVDASKSDLVLTSLVSPKPIDDSNVPLPVTFSMQNLSCQPLTNPTCKFTDQNGTVFTETIFTTIPPNGYYIHTMANTVTIPPGFHELALEIDHPDDAYKANNKTKLLIFGRDPNFFGKDYVGKEFWVSFMHNTANTGSLEQYIHITSTENATVTLTYPLLGWTKTVTVQEHKVTPVHIPTEIAGVITATEPSEVVSPTGMYISSDNPISVYGFSGQYQTTDAYLAIPRRTLGKSYVVTAPKGTVAAVNVPYYYQSGPAEFIVVATENNTQVTIQHKVPFHKSDANQDVNVTLNQGETYLVKARIDSVLLVNTGTYDLSGTMVYADKKVAVFGGSQCAKIPIQDGLLPSCDYCDHLIEQLPPLATLSTKFVVTDFDYKPGNDMLRFVNPNTQPVQVQAGAQLVTVDSKGFKDIMFNGSMTVESDMPIHVSQYCTGSLCLPISMSDPFMINITPHEQWGNFYSFTAAEAVRLPSHYINIVKKSAGARVGLDGFYLDPSLFTQIPGSEFYTAKLPVAVGPHVVVCDSICNVIVYGYGYENSYGYPASGSFLKPTNLPPLEASEVHANIRCFGDSTGTITITATGGEQPLNYIWDDGYSGSYRDSLPIGTYSVHIFDDFSSDTTILITLTQPDSLQANLTKTDIKCFNQRSGKASVSPSGGIGPYQILWNDLGTTPTKSNLRADEYWVTITDASGCKRSDTLEIVEPAQIIINATKQNPLCFGENLGWIKTDVQGGFTPYTFSWSGYANNLSDSLVNIPSGQYQLTVTDAGGCKKDTAISLTNPPVFRVESSATGIGCYESATGTAEISLSGGGGTAYGVTWAVNGSTDFEVSNLTNGYHYFTATDGFCVKYDSVFIDSIHSPNFTITTTPANCNQADGRARAIGAGGSGIYIYQWQTSPQQNSQQATGLLPGDYTLIATDNVCTDTLDFEIENLGAPTFNFDFLSATCNENNGEAYISNLQFTQGFTIDWGIPSLNNLDTAIGLAPGDYTVTVTDSACSASESFSIPDIQTFDVQDTNFTLPNCGVANGEIVLTVQPGDSPINFSWSSGSSSNSSGSVMAGTHLVEISDDYCIENLSLALSNAGGPDITMTPSPATCSEDNGTIMVSHNGNGAYVISWSHDASLNQLTANNLAAGNYSITLTENNCVYTASVEVENRSEPRVREFITHATCGDANGEIIVVANGGTGSYSFSWDYAISNITNAATQLPSGDYEVSVDDGNCVVTRTYTVNNIPGPTATTSSADATCGSDNGSAQVVLSGGTGSYTYLWNDNVSTSTPSVDDLATGTYRVIFSDDNCTDSAFATVGSVPPPTLSHTTTPAYCEGGNGTISVSLTGQNPTISWDEPGLSGTVLTVDSGTYHYTLTDDNCSLSGSITVGYTSMPVVPSPDITPTTCGLNNGSASVSPVSGYSFEWIEAGVTGNSVSNLSPGTYHLVMFNANCSDTLSFTVNAVPEFTLAEEFTAAACNENNGMAGVIATGGAGSFSYAWDDFPTNDSSAVLGVGDGTYTVHVSDLHCTQSFTVTVPRNDAPTLTEVRRRNSYCNADNGYVIFNPQGGTGTYSYTWTPSLPVYGDSTALIGPGTYQLVFSDGVCSETLTYTNTNQALPSLTVVPSQPDACNRGIGEAYVLGSLPEGFTYRWSAGRINGDTASLLATGEHFVTISGFGCDTLIPFFIDNLPQNDMRISVTPDTCNKSVGTISFEPINANGRAAFAIAGFDFEYRNSFEGLPHGNYTVSMVDSLQCYVQYDTLIPHVIPAPTTKNITTEPAYPIVDQEFEIIGEFDPNWTLTQWQVNGEDLGTVNPLSYIYQGNDELVVVKALLVNENLCTDSAFLYRDIDPGVSVYIPNSFTPDNDGFNDWFFPVIRGITEVEGYIFNRWGEVIYEFTDREDRWDGTYERVPVQTGLYNYRFNFVTTSGNHFTETGHVTILR